MERSLILENLKTLIEDHSCTTITGPDQDLDIDSFTMMLILTYIDEEMDVTINMDSLDFESFKSLTTFADIVMEKAGTAK